MKKKILLLMIILLLISNMISFAIPVESSTIKNIFADNASYYRQEIVSEKLTNRGEKFNREASEMILNFTGDFSIGVPNDVKNPIVPIIKKNPKYFLENVFNIFKHDDYTVINLENVITDYRKSVKEKKYNLRADSDCIKILKNNSIEIASVMNNHSHDFSKKGFDDTISSLKAANIKPIGFNNIIDENPELAGVSYDSKAIVGKNNIKVGIVNYFSFAKYHPKVSKIKKDFKDFKDQKVDFIVVHSHGGGQDTKELKWYQPIRAKEFIDLGADLVINNHPHTIQKMEIYQGKRIYHSLGNFLFVYNYKDEDNLGVLLNIKLKKDKNGEIIDHYRHIPINWLGNGITNNYQPSIVSNKKAFDYLHKYLNVKKDEITMDYFK